MPKITPKQAFDAIKVLYPDVTYITCSKTPGSVQPNLVVHAWDARAYGRDVFPEARIDWGTQTQYPETVYRDATIDDIKTQPEAEFSDHPAFGNTTSGKLTGYLMLGQSPRWYCGFPNHSAISYNYCRISIPAPEPAPPEGWDIIREEHKQHFSAGSNRYAEIKTESGKVYRPCFWAQLGHTVGWRSAGGWIESPKYIRPMP